MNNSINFAAKEAAQHFAAMVENLADDKRFYVEPNASPADYAMRCAKIVKDISRSKEGLRAMTAQQYQEFSEQLSKFLADIHCSPAKLQQLAGIGIKEGQGFTWKSTASQGIWDLPFMAAKLEERFSTKMEIIRKGLAQAKQSLITPLEAIIADINKQSKRAEDALNNGQQVFDLFVKELKRVKLTPAPN